MSENICYEQEIACARMLGWTYTDTSRDFFFGPDFLSKHLESFLVWDNADNQPIFLLSLLQYFGFLLFKKI